MKVVEDFESRPHKAVSSVIERERGGTERAEAVRHCLATMESVCQEEAQRGRQRRGGREGQYGKIDKLG